MRIGIDVTTLGAAYQDKGGIYQHVFHLVKALKEIDQENSYKLWVHYFRSGNKGRYDQALSLLNLNGDGHFRLVRSSLPNYRGWYLNLPVEPFIGGVDIFHGPAHFVMPALKSKTIVTIHDIDFLKVPEHLDPDWVQFKDKYTRLAMQRADRIITVSEFMKKEILRYFDVPADRIRVVYNGVAPWFSVVEDRSLIQSVLDKYAIPSPYILFVGTFHENKNLIRLLKAFRRLKTTYDLPHRLVLAGGDGRASQAVKQQITELHIEEIVSLPGYIPDVDLPALYSGADLFVFPSLYEGFGIPVAEAMACGVPVVSSNVSCLPEIVGDSGVLVDPLDEGHWVESIYSVLSDKGFREGLIRKGFDRANRFSWVRAARDTLEIYKEAFPG